MNFSIAVQTCFSKFLDFTGRAQRSEFWYFFLFSFLLQLLIEVATGSEVASGLASLGLLIPSIAVGARRLHDTSRSGWWQLLVLIPLLGWIVLLVFMVKRGDEGENDYGYDPLDRTVDPHEPARHDMNAEPARREPGKSEYRSEETDARDTETRADTDDASNEDNPWVKARRENSENAKTVAAKAKADEVQKQITEEKKRRIEPPKFGRDAAKKD